MLRIPPFPTGEPLFSSFTCTVNGQPVPLHTARVSAIPYNQPWPGYQRPLDQTELSGFATFETDEAVEVVLSVDHPFSEVTVRPLSKAVKVQTDGCTLRFTLTEHGAYTVELDDQHRSLTLFSRPVRDFGVSPEDPDTIYFGPGVHRPGVIWVKSGQTVYLEAGAVVYGTVAGVGVHDVRILGYGILDGSNQPRQTECCYPWTPENRILSDDEIHTQLTDGPCSFGMLLLFRGGNIEIEGPTLRDSAVFCGQFANLSGLTVRQVNLIGMWRYNSDGLDLFNCQNVLIEDCFLRTFDDSVVIKGISGYDDQPNENITVRGCTIWNDWGASLEIGAETCAPYYRHILFENCDLIRGSSAYMRIHHWNQADISEVTYRNIRCEYSRHHHSGMLQVEKEAPYTDRQPTDYPRPFHLLIRNGIQNAETGGYCFKEKSAYRNGAIHDIHFENIQLLADPGVTPPAPCFEGLDTVHDIKRVTVDGLFLNGQRLTDPSLPEIGTFVSDVLWR